MQRSHVDFILCCEPIADSFAFRLFAGKATEILFCPLRTCLADAGKMRAAVVANRSWDFQFHLEKVEVIDVEPKLNFLIWVAPSRLKGWDMSPSLFGSSLVTDVLACVAARASLRCVHMRLRAFWLCVCVCIAMRRCQKELATRPHDRLHDFRVYVESLFQSSAGSNGSDTSQGDPRAGARRGSHRGPRVQHQSGAPT